MRFRHSYYASDTVCTRKPRPQHQQHACCVVGYMGAAMLARHCRKSSGLSRHIFQSRLWKKKLRSSRTPQQTPQLPPFFFLLCKSAINIINSCSARLLVGSFPFFFVYIFHISLSTTVSRLHNNKFVNRVGGGGRKV